MGFEPIAVVGRGCVLPGALHPDQLWSNVAAGEVSLSAGTENRWRVPPEQVLGVVGDDADRAWTRTGGYVHGFEAVFDAGRYLLPAEEIAGFDPLLHWALYAAGQALSEAGFASGREPGDELPGAGLVMGNLCYPTDSAAAFAEHVWLERQQPTVRDRLLAARGPRPDPRNRFGSGLPSHLAARALGLAEGGFALDAACASSLYALKLACERLHDRTADLMVAGAVHRVDHLLVGIGFSALGAMSPTGRSRPFDRAADGLLPAEGAGFFALMRIADAVRQNRPVLAVIRGIGLSNDGRSAGLLAPSQSSQEAAMRQAYQAAGIEPASVSLLECHATGTPLGDAVEARSSAVVFAGAADLPIGSVKANFGHALAAAGAAGLLKLIGAQRSGIRPSTPGVEEPITALRDTPLRPLTAAEPWTGPRRAALSSFGLGGANAHLVLDPGDGYESPAVAAPPSLARSADTDPAACDIAVVAVGARVNGLDADGLHSALLAGRPAQGSGAPVDVSLDGLRVPPRDLKDIQPQHLMVLEAARDAAASVRLPGDRTMVLIGMGADCELTRNGARWRVPAWLDSSGLPADAITADESRRAFTGEVGAGRTSGAVPNLVASRINAHLDLTGPGFAVCAEEASGVTAVHLAARALRNGEADAAIVGAVDIGREPVHLAALGDMGRPTASASDGAVVLILKRLTDARSDGDPVLAVLPGGETGPPGLVVGTSPETGTAPGDGAAERSGTVAADQAHDQSPEHFDPTRLLGSAHAAQGMLDIAAAVTALRYRAQPQDGGPATPDPGLQTVEVVTPVLGAPEATLRLAAGDPAPWPLADAPGLHVYSGADRTEVIAALEAGRSSRYDGPARLTLVTTAADLSETVAAARRWLSGQAPRPASAAYQDRPLTGEVAFVYTNGSAHYDGAGQSLARLFPELAEAVGRRYGPPPADEKGVLAQIWGSASTAALHTELSRNVLGLAADAALGYSSGESAALSALGAWPDAEAMRSESLRGGLFAHDVTGEHRAARRTWRRLGLPGDRWLTCLVHAGAAEARAAVDASPNVHLMAVLAPDICIIGGEESACRALTEHHFGRDRAVQVDYDIAAHAPELTQVRREWRRLHHRPTVPVPGVRFYRGADAGWYYPTADSAADALTDQMTGTVDFSAVVESAYADGVRIFVEHGPGNLCTGWIKRTLADREHLALAWDAADSQGVEQLCRTVGELVAAGVDIDADAFFNRITTATPAIRTRSRTVRLPVLQPPVVLALPERGTTPPPMPPAPSLPPVLREAADVTQPAPAVARLLCPPSPPTEGDVPTRLVRTLPRRGTTADAHEEFLQLSAATQMSFLRLRQQQMAALLAVADPSAVLSVALPASPLSPTPQPTRPPETAPDPRRLSQPLPARPVVKPPVHPGPSFDRAALERLASGPVSELFGPRFAAQDGRPRQTRMPEPPMLLADRVLGIDAEPASMGTGTIWTETDVRLDSWYLDPAGRMPPAIMIEAGQADLLLISWLGIDLHLDGDRVYRLLGCEVTYYGEAPRPGETLRYEIHIDGHAEHDGVRLFFFHYDCTVDGRLRLRMRGGQAGFFTDRELSEADGVCWHPDQDPPESGTLCDPPAVECIRSDFGADRVRAFVEGRPADCFGPGWEATRSHIRPPTVDLGDLLLFDEITSFDPHGGPWGRGYLRGRAACSGDSWFFDGHFKNDPCMPGTLMLQGGLQTMAFYLAAMGYTVDRDGWRFEAVPEEPQRFSCRGQVTRDSREIVYEVFVRRVSAGPEPTLRADLLCTVDGVRAFHGSNIALRLVPDWPLDHWRHLSAPTVQTALESVPLRQLGGLLGHHNARPTARAADVPLDFAAFLATAWGRCSQAMGAQFAPLDGPFKVPRLPGPPYLFVSRITSLDAVAGSAESGALVEAEYDLHADAWYFEEGCPGAMPMAVLMEAVLQPCGWLAFYVLGPDRSPGRLLMRNLDGTTTVYSDVRPTDGALRTRGELTAFTQYGDTTLATFRIRATADGRPVLDMSSVFGFFPPEVFTRQVGLGPDQPTTCDEPAVAAFRRPPGAPDLVSPRGAAGPSLHMLDRITGYWPTGGSRGLGLMRAERDIDPDDWIFKVHFFQDSVQPGSLGVDALCQLLRHYLANRYDIPQDSRFEPVLPDQEVKWTYRGQIVPSDTLLTLEVDVQETGTDGQGPYAIAEGRLWADGRWIYRVTGLGMRASQGRAPQACAPEAVPWATSPNR
ncbi:beta keto-acyl synthase [Streptomyces sp. ISL-14]|nr:beta keto-acyl synthase [Streptomyces sp. ISL-14]